MNAVAESHVEQGQYGRVFAVRVRPNEDLVESLRTLAATQGLRRAVIKGAVGSLIDGNLAFGPAATATKVHIPGPGVEILSINGDIRVGEDGQPNVRVQGTLGGLDGKVYAGTFVPGGNLAFITMEVVVQEWVPSAA